MNTHVPHSTGLAPQYFNPYYSNHNLLFQFILSEFILVYQEIKHINQIAATLKSQENFELEILQRLLHHIVKLAGSSRYYMRLLACNDDGLLTKLKCYSVLFCLKQDHMNQRKLYDDVEQLWLLSLKIVDTTDSLLLRNSETAKLALHSWLGKFQRSSKRLSNTITSFKMHFRHDENVIFFIMRHKEQFDDLYKPRYVAKLLKKMFPNGLKEAHQFLLSQYGKRGFDSLVPIIQTKMAELEA